MAKGKIMATYSNAISAAAKELAESYAAVVSGVKRCDAMSVAGRLFLPRGVAGERFLVARYDGDGRKFTAGTTGAPTLVNGTAAAAFIFKTLGGELDGVQLSVTNDGSVEGLVVIPLLGDEPYPEVDDRMVRWAVKQSVRAGAAIAAVSLFTALCDAGLTTARANLIIRRGFGRYAEIMKDCEIWNELMARRR